MNFIRCNNSDLAYRISEVDNSGGDFVIFLHGGSKELGKDRFRILQEQLKSDGVSSLAFDFSGVGESSGYMQESSLDDRVDQAVRITRHVQKQYPQKKLSLYGASMGGYTALAATQKLPGTFKNLILHAPAAYAREAHGVNFNESFTKILRRSDSWQGSLSFQWLDDYTGNVLFFIGEGDEVIPRGVTKKYSAILSPKSNAAIITIPDMDHSFVWSDERIPENSKELIYRDILRTIQR